MAAWSLLFPTQPPPFWLSDNKGRERKRENQEERERGLVQGNEEAERVLSDGVLPTQNPSLYCPALLLYF